MELYSYNNGLISYRFKQFIMKTIQLLYRSNSSASVNVGDFEDILVTARNKNNNLGITGLLMYSNGVFVQCIEGEEHAVNKLFSEIYIDDRHYNVNIVGRVEISKRTFPDWKMGFVNLEDSKMKRLGFIDIFSVLKDLSKDPRSLVKFMETYVGSRSLREAV